MGRGLGAGAVGRAADWGVFNMAAAVPLALATSQEFLKLCWSVGILNVGVKLFLQFSSSFVNNVLSVRLDVLSVRGELSMASHKKEEEKEEEEEEKKGEEEEERGGIRLMSRDPVLSRLNG